MYTCCQQSAVLCIRVANRVLYCLYVLVVISAAPQALSAEVIKTVRDIIALNPIYKYVCAVIICRV